LFGSNYSSTVWQILSELKYSNSPVTPGSLQIELKIPPSTLSQICMRYEKEGWLSRIQDTGDRRQKVLAITPVGQLALSTIEEAGASILLRAFGDDAGKAGPRFCTLLEKYLHGELIRNEGVIRPQISMTEIAGDEERRAARGFFVFHLARLGRYLRVPESLIAASSTAFVVKSAQQVIAVIQVRDANLDKSSGEGLVVDLVHSETASDPTLIGDLLIALTRRVFRDGHADQTLVVSRDDLPSGTQEYLASKNALGIMLIVP
jgi:DNA-binding MarR family transcriptional regulator